MKRSIWFFPGMLLLLAGSAQARVRASGAAADSRVEAKIERVLQKHGLDFIEGPAITVGGLEVLDEALSFFRRRDLKRLGVRFERPASARAEEAVWIPYDDEPPAPGEEDPSPCDASGGEMRVFQTRPQLHVLVHEIAHHVTLLTDPALLVEVAAGLGYGTKDAGEDLCERLRSERPFSAWRVDDATFPNDYARESVYEHVAEILAWHLAQDSFVHKGWPVEKGFRVPDALVRKLQARFSP